MILFLHGPNSFQRKQRVDVLRSAFQKKFDPAGHNIALMGGKDFSIQDFHTQTKSGGLFSTKRFILFTDIWSLNKDDQTTLIEQLDAVDSDTILCISADKPPRKDNALFKRLLTADTVEEFGDLDHSQLRSFITQEAQQRGASIDSPAIAALISSIGNDLWRMSNTLNALAHHSQNITAQDTELFLDANLNDNIFDLTDALGTKNAKRALQLLDEQFLLGSNEHYLITMLGKHIHNLLLVKQTDGKGVKLHPYVIKKSLAQGKTFTEETLKQLHSDLLAIDIQLKSSRTDARVLLDQFVTRVCQ
jgi:DNA polymerase-3 subunit delta